MRPFSAVAVDEAFVHLFFLKRTSHGDMYKATDVPTTSFELHSAIGNSQYGDPIPPDTATVSYAEHVPQHDIGSSLGLCITIDSKSSEYG